MKLIAMLIVVGCGSLYAMDEKTMTQSQRLRKQVTFQEAERTPQETLHRYLVRTKWSTDMQPCGHQCAMDMHTSHTVNSNCTNCLLTLEMHLLDLLATIKPLWELEAYVKKEAETRVTEYEKSISMKLDKQMGHAQTIRRLLIQLALESQAHDKK